MPPVHVVPDSLAALLPLIRPSFTAPSFDTFCRLVVGFASRVGERTVCRMWPAARLAGDFHHSRALYPRTAPAGQKRGIHSPHAALSTAGRLRLRNSRGTTGARCKRAPAFFS